MKKLLLISLVALWSCSDFDSTQEDDKPNDETVQSNEDSPAGKKSTTFSEVLKEVQNSQTFEINNTKDTMIRADQGTEFSFPAGCFSGVKGKVKIEIKECYKVSDFVRNNLTTTSGNELLGSNGMVYIGTPDYPDMQLDPDKPITVKMPSTSGESSQLFYGERDENGVMDWAAAGQEQQASDKDLIPRKKTKVKKSKRPQRQPMDTYEGEENTMPPFTNPFCVKCLSQMKKLITYPNSAAASRLSGKVYAQLTIDSDGIITKAEIFKGLSKDIDKMVLDGVNKIPQFVPAFVNGETSKATTRLEFIFDGKDYTVKMPKQFTWTKTKAFIYKKWKTNVDGEETFTKGIETSSGETVEVEVTAKAVKGYIFRIAKLGWANCDYLLGSGVARIAFNINSDVEFADMMFVFKGTKTTVPALYNREKNLYAILSIPEGQEGTLISVAKKDGKLLCASTEATAGTDVTVTHSEKTYSELDEMIKGLD